MTPVAEGFVGFPFPVAPTATIPSAGLALWLDATRGVALDGATTRVAAWASRAGSAAVSQPTTASMPTLASLNGLPALQFDGADDALGAASFSLPQPATWFAVAKLGALGASKTIVDGKQGTPTGRHILGYAFVASGQWVMSAGTDLKGGTPDTGAHTLAAEFNGSSGTLYIDGAVVGTGPVGGQTQDGMTLGSRGSTGGNVWLGLVGEVIAYGRILSASERGQVLAYLRAKWGTP